MKYTQSNKPKGLFSMAKKALNIFISLILIAAGAVFLQLFIFSVPRHIFNAGSLIGAAVGTVLIALGVFMPLVKKAVSKMWKNRIGKGFLIAIISIVAIALALFFAALGTIISAQANTAENQKTLIVLGCQIRGSTPSRMLSDRINAAYDYLSENPEAVAVLSGGQGADEDLSEAQCMFNILTEKGISPDRLFIEDKSKNTDENIKNSLEIIEKNNLSKEVAVSTNDYHQKRAAMICSKYGLEARAVNAQTQAYLVPVFYTREVLGVAYEYVFK